MLHLIYGENTTLIDTEIESIHSSHPDIPFEKIKGTTSLKDIKLQCESIDMFCPQKGWIVKQPTWLKKSDKANIATLNEIINLLISQKMPLVVVTKSIDKRSSAYKLFKKTGFNEKKCDQFKDWETDKMMLWLTTFCKKKGITISTEAIQQLLNGYGNNLDLIKQEIEKIAITIHPKETIEAADLVHATSNSFGYYNCLSQGILTGNKTDIIKSIYHLVNLKEDPHKILNQILFQINGLIPIYYGINAKLNHDQLASKLGKHPFFIKKQIESIRKNKLGHQLSKIVINIADLDKKIKQGKLTGKQALIALSNQIKHQ
jgi:DNA polymerase III delta subunit